MDMAHIKSICKDLKSIYINLITISIFGSTMKHLTWAPGSDNMPFIHITMAIDICLNSNQPTSTKEDTQQK